MIVIFTLNFNQGTLEGFHFRWSQIQHYQDKEESSNYYLDSVVASTIYNETR